MSTMAGTGQFEQGEIDMGDRGSKDKGKREKQKKAQRTPREKRKLKRRRKTNKGGMSILCMRILYPCTWSVGDRSEQLDIRMVVKGQ